MLQINTFSVGYVYRPYNLKWKMMPSADKAERLFSTCLFQAGSSGYLRPGASMRVLE